MRDLPGVAELERSARGQAKWLTEAELQDEADKVSIALFGISSHDTFSWQSRPDVPFTEVEIALWDSRPDNWEDYFEELSDDYCRTGAEWISWWASAGVDATDGDGGLLRCSHNLARQLVALLGGLIPEAKFTPNGSGQHLAGADADAARWGIGLEQEAARFKGKR